MRDDARRLRNLSAETVANRELRLPAVPTGRAPPVKHVEVFKRVCIMRLDTAMLRCSIGKVMKTRARLLLISKRFYLYCV